MSSSLCVCDFEKIVHFVDYTPGDQFPRSYRVTILTCILVTWGDQSSKVLGMG